MNREIDGYGGGGGGRGGGMRDEDFRVLEKLATITATSILIRVFSSSSFFLLLLLI
jgi:hypothetical protein